MFSSPFLQAITRLYYWIIAIFSNFQSIFIFLMRITWGYQFWLAGLGKLTNPGPVVKFFESLGIFAPAINAYLVGSIETIGGACLILGFAARLMSIPLATVMFVAYSTAHVHAFKDFAFITNPTLLVTELPFAFLLTTLIVLLFGPGRISIDGWVKRVIEKKEHYR